MKTNSILPMLVLGMIASLCAENASAQRNLTADLLKPTREIAADEECLEYITGQFYFKICRDEEETVIKERTVIVEERCVVYDKVKCCNVIVIKKVPKKEKYEETVLRPKEIVICKQFRVRLDELESLPDCPCSDEEFLKANKALAPQSQVSGKPVATDAKRTTLAAAKQSDEKAANSESTSKTTLVPIQWEPTSTSRQAPSQERTADSVRVSRPLTATRSVSIRLAASKPNSGAPLALTKTSRPAQAPVRLVTQPQSIIVQRSAWPSIHTLPDATR